MLRFMCTTLSTVMAGVVPATTWRWLMLIACVCCVASGARDNANAQQRPARFEIWDLKLGTAATDLPDEFTDYACGTNGGPPSLALSHWREFRRCRPEQGGLRVESSSPLPLRERQQPGRQAVGSWLLAAHPARPQRRDEPEQHPRPGFQHARMIQERGTRSERFAGALR